MITGLLSGVLWALDTVILSVALSMNGFNNELLFLVPFISTFLHDLSSAIYLIIFMFIKKQKALFIKALKSKAGKYIIIGALFGGPIGMSCYIIAIKNIGPGYTAVISSMYPALGAFFAHIFLKENMNKIQVCGLILSILGIIILGYNNTSIAYNNAALGFICAVLCCISWGSEAVICAYGMKDPMVNNEQALRIRQITSAIIYMIMFIFMLNNSNDIIHILSTRESLIIYGAAFFGTVSYLFYYKAIMVLGASKAMPLNITYSAWAILFSFIILNTLPDIKMILCGIVIVIGALLAATDIYKFFREID